MRIAPYFTLTALTLALLIAPYGAAYAASGDDKTDRLSQTQSHTFSPGYINVAKQRAESIVNQAEPKRSFLEQAIEYAKDKLGRKTKERASANQTINPVLQNKTGSINERAPLLTAGAAASATVVVDSDIIPAHIFNKISSYVESYDDLGSTSYKIKYSNGRYYAAWGNNADSWDDVAPCNIKAQVFDSNGEKIEGTEPIVLSSDSPLNWVGLSDVVTLANGSIAVFWDEEDADTYYSCKVQTLDSNGNKASDAPITLTGDSPVWYAVTTNVTKLANGGMAVFWSEENSDLNWSSNVQILDSGGSKLVPPVALENGGGGLDIYVGNAVSLANGNIAVFMDEPNSWDDPTGNWSINVRLLNSDGRESGAPSVTLTGDILEIDDLTGDWLVVDEYIDSITALANGYIAVAVGQQDSEGNWFREKMVMFDSTGSKLDIPPIVLTYDRLLSVSVNHVALLANGGMLVFSDEQDLEGRWSSKAQIVDSNGERLSAPVILADDNEGNKTYVDTVFTLGSGDTAVFLDKRDADGNWFCCEIIMFDSEGNRIDVPPVVLTGDTPLSNFWINNVTTLADGGMAVFWEGRGLDGEHTFTSQALDHGGNFASPDLLTGPTLQTGHGILSISSEPLYNPFVNTFNLGSPNNISPYFNTSNSIYFPGVVNLSDAFRLLLTNNDILSRIMTGDKRQWVSEYNIRNALLESAFFTPIPKYLSASDAEAASRLISILMNPTEDQKMVIESITELLQDMNKVEQESGQSPELTKAQNDLIQMVANVLLAQAIPDLFSKGEVAGIKDVFKDLDTRKVAVMLEYQEATTPYYESIKKDLMKNMAILQLNNILSKNMMEDELRNASRSQMDEVIQKLKKSADEFFEKDYILQQEAKYREKYLDPNKKKLESDTRAMLDEFTKRLSEKLKQAKK